VSIVVHTIGHSTRPIETFLALLHRERLQRLIDVRAYPRSRRHPQFDRDALAESLTREGISYTHAAALGGRRRGRADSPNTAWRNDSFRAYADHLTTAEFQRALDRVITSAEESPTVVMCAEALPWKCHRWLISDALVARGCEVHHVLDAGTEVHALHECARVADGIVTYPAPPEEGAIQAELFREGQ
jgi:uncharacterized protein (DUF488 family)